MAAGRSPIVAATKRAYAQKMGITVRCAALHWAQSPRPQSLIDFLEEYDNPKPQPLEVIRPSQLADIPERNLDNVPDLERQMIRQMEIYEVAVEAWKDVTRRCDINTTLIMARNVSDALSAYHRARERYELWQETSRQLIKTSEIEAAMMAMEAAFTVLHGMPDEVAAAANPDQPNVARNAVLAFLKNRFEPLALAAIREQEDILQ